MFLRSRQFSNNLQCCALVWFIHTFSQYVAHPFHNIPDFDSLTLVLDLNCKSPRQNLRKRCSLNWILIYKLEILAKIYIHSQIVHQWIILNRLENTSGEKIKLEYNCEIRKHLSTFLPVSIFFKNLCAEKPEWVDGEPVWNGGMCQRSLHAVNLSPTLMSLVSCRPNRVITHNMPTKPYAKLFMHALTQISISPSQCFSL